MFRSAAVIALSGWALAACSPVFNWREVRALPAGLKAALPCKPDKGARDVSMAGRDVSLQVLGCDTGGATFALMFADVGDAGRTGEVLALWKAASLANLRSTAGARRLSFLPERQPCASRCRWWPAERARTAARSRARRRISRAAAMCSRR